MKLLLDTCVFLWLAQQADRIDASAAEVINDESNVLLLSDVSVLEITLKNSAGKLPLPDSPRKWIPSKVKFHQLRSVAVTQEVIFRSGELPRVHLDPFDRLLAAQAIEDGLTILSPDEPLSQLGASRIW